MRYCVAGDTRVGRRDGTRPHRRHRARRAAPSPTTPSTSRSSTGWGDPVHATKLFHSGEHPTLRLRTREGYEITGTHNHPVLCLVDIAGVPVLQWKRLEEIRPATACSWRG